MYTAFTAVASNVGCCGAGGAAGGAGAGGGGCTGAGGGMASASIGVGCCGSGGLLHNEQRQQSLRAYFCLCGLNSTMNSEKNLSPVSLGNGSAFGKGASRPTASASSLR